MSQRLVATALFMLLTCASTFAQTRYELYPYAGGFFPRSSNSDYGQFRNEGIFGVKGAVRIPSNWEFGGNFGYISHFQPEPGSGFWEAVAPQNRSSVRGFIIEMTGDYNLVKDIFGSKVTPYVGGGLGVLTAHVTETANGDRTFFLAGGIPQIPGTNTGTHVIAINNNDSFFSISYGGGVKFNEVWGPLGFRGDLRGRTLPNVGGHSITALELTGGLTFVWGEK